MEDQRSGADKILELQRRVAQLEKELERVLGGSASNLFSIVENTQDIIARFDKEKRHIYISPSVRTRGGFPPEYYLGKTLEEAGMPAAVAELQGRWIDEVFRTGKPSPVLDFQAPSASETEEYGAGETRYYEARMVPEFGADGLVESVLIFNREVTDNIFQKRALEEMVENFKALSERSMMGLIILQDGLVKYANQSLAEITEYTVEEMQAWRAEEFIKVVHPDHKEFVLDQARKKQAGDKDAVPHYSYKIVSRSGRIKWLDSFSKPVTLMGRFADLISVIDISEQKKAEEALKESERKYRELYEEAPNAYVTVDAGGIVRNANRKAADQLNMTLEELIGSNAIDLYPDTPDGKPKVQRVIETFVSGREVHGEELEMIKSDGSSLWTRLYVRPVFNEKGEVIESWAIATDITETKLAEEELRKSEQRFDFAIGQIPGLFWTVDLDCRFTCLMGSSLDKLGVDPSRVLGTTLFEYFNTSDEKFYPIAVQYEAFQKKSVSFEHERDGNWFDGHVAPLCDERGEVIGALGLAIDVTDRKRALEMARVSERNYQSIFETSPDGIVICAPDGRLLEANKAFREMLGYTAEEIREKTYRDITPDKWSEDDERAVKRILDGRGGIGIEKEYIKKDGTVFPVHVLGWLIQDEEGGVEKIGSFVKDVTHARMIEEELRKAHKLESVGVLAGGIAHDFNNLITVILGNVTLARMEEEKDKREKFLEMAESACARSRDLTQQLLTFSRGGAPVKKSVSIGEIIRNSTEFALRGSNVKPLFDFSDGLWPAEVDEGQISQVVQNLVINADQAMPAGGTLKITAENLSVGPGSPEALPEGRYLKLGFEDEGIGISQKCLPRVFDPYFTTKQKGSGLGLAVTYSIVKKHGGAITVTSKLGEGSTFCVFLQASEAGPTRTDKAGKPASRIGGKALIMDDEEMVRITAAEMLRSLGMEVDTAADGEEAARKYQSAFSKGDPYKVVIMDLTIPGGMGGKEAVKAVLSIDPKARVMVASGYSNDPVIANHKDYGFKAAIVKPFLTSELAEAIEGVVADEGVTR